MRLISWTLWSGTRVANTYETLKYIFFSSYFSVELLGDFIKKQFKILPPSLESLGTFGAFQKNIGQKKIRNQDL